MALNHIIKIFRKRVSLFLKRYDIIDLTIYCDTVIKYKYLERGEDWHVFI